MAMLPIHYGGHWEYGSDEIHGVVVISSKGVVKRARRWVSYGPIPGIY